MSKETVGVLKNSIIYSVGNILLKVCSFLLIPLYTAYLSPDQYGIINLAMGFVTLVSCIIMSGLQYAAVRFYADIRDDYAKKKTLISTLINYVLLSSISIFIIFFITKNLWIKYIFENINSYNVIILTLVLSSISGIYYLYQELLKGMQQAKKSVVLTYIYFFSQLGINIIAVVVFKWGAIGILLSNVIVVLIMVALMFIDLIRSKLYSLIMDKGLLINILRYSLPLLPHTLAFNISNFYSRVIINSKLSISELGLFSLASQFGMVADQVSNSVQSAFQPWLFQKLNSYYDGNKDSIKEIRSLTTMLLWLYGAIYLLIGVWAQQAIDLMTTEDYHVSWKYVPVFIMSVAIKSPLYFYQNFMYYHKHKTKYIFMCTISGCAISMILVWVLVPIIGIYGAIIADIIALLFRLCLTNYILRDLDKVYSFRNVIGITVISIIWLGVSVFPSYIHIFQQSYIVILYKTGSICAYIGLIWFLYRAQIHDFLINIRTSKTL